MKHLNETFLRSTYETKNSQRGETEKGEVVVIQSGQNCIIACLEYQSYVKNDFPFSNFYIFKQCMN